MAFRRQPRSTLGRVLRILPLMKVPYWWNAAFTSTLFSTEPSGTSHPHSECGHSEHVSRRGHFSSRAELLQVRGACNSQPDSVQEGLLAPYFGEYVRQQMEKEDEELGVDLYRDGLTIYTTLDSRMQRVANDVLAKELERRQDVFEARLKNPNVTELANILTRLRSPWSEDTVRLWLMDSVVVDTIWPELSSRTV